MYELLANITSPELSGWTGTGLLGAVLFWLLYKHLPEKDRQNRDQQAEHRADIKAQHKMHAEDIDRVHANFTKNLESITDHCKSELVEIAAMHHKETTRILELIKELKKDETDS